MDNKSKILLSSTLFAASFLAPHGVYGIDGSSNHGEPLKPPGVQLFKGDNYTLDAVLGTGNNILLKLSMNLSALKKPLEKDQLEKGQLEVPIRLFLTDFTSSPTSDAPVDLATKVDCESTPPTCIFPNKPSSFDSYAQFEDWLKGGYFTNQVMITYDFHLDVQKTAPTLVKHLFAVMPSYHFIGTYAVDNAAIPPDKCIPKVTYVTKRGNENVTIATVGGTLYLNEKPYHVDSHQQRFSHPVVSQTIFKKHHTKRFYSHKWIAGSEATAKVSYEEFPSHLIKNWPNAPTGTYSILKKMLGDFEEIKHAGCWDGASGEEVDISDGRTFLMDCESINITQVGAKFIESIVKDDVGALYMVHYEYSQAEKQRREAKKRKELEQEAAKARRRIEEEQESIQKLETAEKEKEEKIALWSSGLDIIVQHLNAFKEFDGWVQSKLSMGGPYCKVFFNDLARVVEPMKDYYTSEEQAKLCTQEYPTLDCERLNRNFPSDYNELLSQIFNLMQSASSRCGENGRLYQQWERSLRPGYCCSSEHRGDKQREFCSQEQSNVFSLKCNIVYNINCLLKKKMENYILYQGKFHPRWEEMVKIFGQP